MPLLWYVLPSSQDQTCLNIARPGLEWLSSDCFSWQRGTQGGISPAHNPLCMQRCMTPYRVVTALQLLSHSIKSANDGVILTQGNNCCVFSMLSLTPQTRRFPLRVFQTPASNRSHAPSKRDSFGNDSRRKAHVASGARPCLPLKTF